MQSQLPPPPAARLERPTSVAPFVLGIIGLVLGLIPLLGIVSIILGLIGLPLGVIAWRRTPRPKLARAGTILSACAIALGVIGLVIVSNAFDDLSDDLDCISRSETAAQMEEC